MCRSSLRDPEHDLAQLSALGYRDAAEIVRRLRGTPIDKLVSELMIYVNSTWGRQLAESGTAAIYRVQSTGKVRFSVHPEGHEGLGVSAYAWMSSPLRRYVDSSARWRANAARRSVNSSRPNPARSARRRGSATPRSG